jgi:hypothetical protein
MPAYQAQDPEFEPQGKTNKQKNPSRYQKHLKIYKTQERKTRVKTLAIYATEKKKINI